MAFPGVTEKPHAVTVEQEAERGDPPRGVTGVAAPEALVEFDNVSKTYDGERLAVRELSLAIQKR